MAGKHEFDGWLAARRYADQTRRVYTMYVRRAALHCGDLTTATTDDLTDWLETLPSTAPSHIAGRKALVAYYQFRKMEPSPAAGLPRLPEPRRLPRPLCETDHRRWVDAAHELGGAHELAGTLLASTGARIGELRAARWVDFTLSDPAWWRIRGKSSGRSGPAWRQQPLHQDVVPVLAAVMGRPGECVFPGVHGPVDDATMRALIVEIGQYAGLGRVLPHRIRHSVATLALAQSGDLRAVQELLGHQSIASTVIYTRVLPGRLSSLVAGLPV